MLLSEILEYLEQTATFSLQEDYDNSGLIVGDSSADITKALIALDITEDVMDEAIAGKFNLIISHHPMVFSGMKKFTGKSATERLITRALKKDIAIIALHTNLDNYSKGVNYLLCEKLGIRNPIILRPMADRLFKLVTFCPHSHASAVRESLFNAGAGNIGNYDYCSFNLSGQGTFRALEGASPFVGKPHEIHFEKEERIEVVFTSNLEKKLISTLLKTHPYEEVAYDIYALKNTDPTSGAGMIGQLETPIPAKEFLENIKTILNIGCIRHTSFPDQPIQKIAVCGGSGSFLIKDAIAAHADAFLTGDIKYHDFFLPENRMLLADIGHYESEQYTKQLIFTLLKKKFPTFALRISETVTNPVNYL